MEIRPVAASDADAVADVFLAALAEMTYLPELYTELETRSFITEVLLPNNEVWVAIEDGDLVGFVGFGDGSLRHLWVLPRSQGQGVGTALLWLQWSAAPSGFGFRSINKTSEPVVCMSDMGSGSLNFGTAKTMKRMNRTLSTFGNPRPPYIATETLHLTDVRRRGH